VRNKGRDAADYFGPDPQASGGGQRVKAYCKATKSGGARCRNKSIDSTGFCRSHHPQPSKRPPTGTAFEEKVLKVLRLLGYKVERNVNINGSQIDVYGEYRTGVITLRLMVECKDYGIGKTVGIEEINKFAGVLAVARNTGVVDKGLFVTTEGYTTQAKINARSAGIELTTFKELSTQLVDFTDYIERIISDFKASPASKFYVELSGTEIEEYEGADEAILHRPIDEYVSKILSDDEHRKLALLGNFGTGKSTFCRKYAHDLALSYKDGKTNRIPVIINLSDFDSKLHIQELILNTLQFRYNLNITHTVCHELQRIGRFLFLFDGFDEMASRVDVDTIRENLHDINKVSEIKENKFILTCRTHFFRDRVQAQILTDFDILYIPEWGEAELKEYLQRRFGGNWRYHLERISGTHNLPELAQTPLFLEMIVETLPQLGDEVKRIELYQAYTDKWIQEQSRRKGARLLTEQRSQFVKELAMKLYLEGKLSCHHSEFVPLLRQRFEIDDAAQMDYIRSDVQTCTFLTRDGKGNYSFRHKSFMEFFVAQALAEEISSGKPDRLSPMLLPTEIRGFLVDFLSFSPPADLLKEWLLTSNDQVVKDNVLSLLPRLKIDISDTKLYAEPERDSEVQRTAQFLQGDTEAFTYIYTRYKPALELFLRKRGCPPDDVEDIVIDTFFYAWRAKDRLENVNNLGSFLRLIAQRTYLDLIKQRKRIRYGGDVIFEDEDPSKLIESLPAIQPSPERLAEAEEIRRALNILTPQERNVVLLMAEGESSSDVARALGISSVLVRQLQRRAIDRVRKHLKSK
jgi:RNA polymerase sigma factor (sigma-70 family)